MPQQSILVVDDEKDIADLIAYQLRQEGFDVATAADGHEAWDRIREKRPDLLILDLMLPGIQGMDLCRMLRGNKDTARLPVIMVTAKTDPIDRVLGLEIGADDYITKPFHVKELVARVRAVLRRAERGNHDEGALETLERGDLRIDLTAYKVTVSGRVIDLSAREFKLLAFLARRPGRVYSRDQLLDAVWGDETFVEPRTVDVHISRLRAVIEKDKEQPRFIQTVRGVGYKFSETLQ